MWCRQLALAGLLLGTPAPALAGAVATIPFHLVDHVVVLPVQIQDSDTLWFVLDTGAYHVSVDLPRASQLGLKVTGATHATGGTGTVDAKRLAPFDIRMGSVVLTANQAQAFAFSGFASRIGHALDGVVGAELFQRYVVEIDYAHRLVRLHEPSSFHYEGSGQRLPLTFLQGLPHAQARVELSDARWLAGRFLVDTGSSQAVILLADFLAQNRVEQTVAKTVPFEGLAVGGEIGTRIGRLRALELGELRLEDPLVVLPPPHPGHFATDGSAGNLGGGVFERFRMIFDYARSEMILEPASDLAAPMPFDASGLDLATTGGTFATIVVQSVVPRSPAGEAGILKGDRVIALDGTPAARVGMGRMQERLRHAGDSVTLTVSRGERTWTVPLRLRDLL
ncbi:MAG TPA: aspartyl protease family protein [Candidatus Eisenbacteria bacterium]|nr:aspartyl protease family protein [Candidatus Eisenbacteria bacterium]